MVGLAVLVQGRADDPGRSSRAWRVDLQVGPRCGLDAEGRVQASAEEGPHGRGEPDRPLVPPDPRHGLGQLGDRVVGLQHRAVPGGPARGQPQPGHALLRRLDQVEALAADRDAEPADLTDRLGDALEQFRRGCPPASGRRRCRPPPRRPGRPAPRRAAGGGLHAARWRTTARIIASMSFMSTAPRPQTQLRPAGARCWCSLVPRCRYDRRTGQPASRPRRRGPRRDGRG